MTANRSHYEVGILMCSEAEGRSWPDSMPLLGCFFFFLGSTVSFCYCYCFFSCRISFHPIASPISLVFPPLFSVPAILSDSPLSLLLLPYAFPSLSSTTNSLSSTSPPIPLPSSFPLLSIAPSPYLQPPIIFHHLLPLPYPPLSPSSPPFSPTKVS